MAMTMEEERAASEALCMMLGGSFENWWCFRPDEEDQCTAGAGWTIPRFCRLSKKNQFARCFHCVKRERAAYISDVDVLFQPCDLYLDGVCHPFSDDLKFTVAPSWLGSLDVDITGGGGHTIRVPEYLSAQHPLVQMLLFAGVVNASRFREDVLFSCPQSFVPKCVRSMVKISRSPTNREGEDGVNPDTGAVTVQERISKENNMDNRRGRLSSAGRQLAGKQVPIAALQGHTGRMPWIGDQQGQAASEPDRTTDWEQQQQQQQGSTLNGVNHVAEPELGSPSAGFSIAGDQVWLPACDQGEMEKAATTLGGDISANSGSAASEATCKTSGGLALAAAAEYPNDQHFLKDDAELGGQQRGDGAHDESENLRCFSLSLPLVVFLSLVITHVVMS
ncbi:hypothetical protein BS78_05G274700 [Paspalum vaginatum]|nr:hypothetical protein BS78_05G274700 [Paspalum vaginatum]